MNKNILYIVIILAIIGSSCSEGKDDQIKKISLNSLNIADAKSIFKKTSGDTDTKSDAGSGVYWKIDKNGKESKLVLSDDNNTVHDDIKILGLKKISDEILLLLIRGKYTTSIIDENGKVQITPNIQTGLFFANTETERLFEYQGVYYDVMWNILEFVIYHPNSVPKEDNDGNIYMLSDHNQVVKLDPNTYTLSLELPDNQACCYFDITSDGFIFYSNSKIRGARVKCPGDRIVILDHSAFMCNDEIFTSDGNDIYQWSKIGNNNLKREFVCEFLESEYSLEAVIENHANNSVLLNTAENVVVEFDGVNKPEIIKDFPVEFFSFGSDPLYRDGCKEARTKNALYIYADSELTKLDLSTYQASIIPTTGIEIHNITYDERYNGFSFTGIRYDDGKNIIGSISVTDEITTELSLDSGEKAIALVELF